MSCFFFIINYCFIFLLGLKEIKSASKYGWIACYRCVQYRASSDGSRLACNCTIKIQHSDQVVIRSKATHENCGEALKRARLSDIAAPVAFNGTIHDLADEMLAICKSRAIENTSLSAQSIADTLAHEFDLQYIGRMATFSSRDQLLLLLLLLLEEGRCCNADHGIYLDILILYTANSSDILILYTANSSLLLICLC